VADLVGRWQKGERPLAEEYLDRQPELWEQPEAALELIAEELVLRGEHDQPIGEEELLRRFPQWQAQVRVLFDCQKALGTKLGPPKFPEAGEKIGGFELLTELGRGAHGRVFLATQPALADRPVVLKLGPWGSGEHLSLARLQHTHIVPLYSAHEFPKWGLVGLCLPYFGGATLADLPEGPVRERGDSPGANDFLQRANPSEAVCWVGACLADALQYAHDRGLLHLDLKPSNVLIAADGTPMLLDFHLARGPIPSGQAPPTRLGGTHAYMAPEQKAAMQAVMDNKPLTQPVDGRADIYALGLVLQELWEKLSGADRRSVAVSDILARCTAERAEGRYATAAALASDLRRHLMHLPLKGVGNRSVRERWRKWRRRRPVALPVALTLLAILISGLGFFRHSDRQAERAQTALRDGEGHLASGRYTQAAEVCRSGESMLGGLPFHGALRDQLAATRTAAEKAEAAGELHRLCEAVRPLYAAENLPPTLAAEAASRCRELWDRRAEAVRRLQDQPTVELERLWRTDLLDLGILTAYLESLPHQPGSLRKAVQTLDEAESLLGESGLLFLERARLARALNQTGQAEEFDRRARHFTPNSAWEHLVVGRSQLASGDVRPALASIDHCLDLEPQSVWGHYYRGVCCLRLEESTDAIASFTACAALAPRSAWCVYNRGLAYSHAGRFDRASTDFGRTLELDPSFGLAYLARAAVRHQAGHDDDALADLDLAAGAGIPRTMAEYQKALVYLAKKDRAAAAACLRTVLSLDPSHDGARRLLGQLEEK
jgi:tetratricopeptide (TPR) repeat protein